tara:strand:- start:9967 stop:11169 length:1203 start_codon:yes stop_codon:yes gene_type:complete
MDLNNWQSEPIVVLGGGFGGLSTVMALVEKSNGIPIILIDQSARFIFKPLLYELLSDELQLWEVAPKYSFLASELGFIFLKETVVEIDAFKRKVITSSGFELNYSQLVMSTGLTTDFDGTKGLKEYAYGLSNLKDLVKIKKLIYKINNSSDYDYPLVISGAGPTGVELACKISDLVNHKIKIYLIDKGDKILSKSKSFNREKAIKALEKRNIKIYLGHFIKSVNSNYCELISDYDEDNNIQNINYSGLIWTARLKPSLLDIVYSFSNGMNRVQVNEFLQIEEFKNIFFVGDITTNINTFFPSSAQGAMQQGFTTAHNILSLRKGEQLQTFEFHDLGEMLSLGIGNASITAYGMTLAGPLAFEIRRLIYLMRMPGLSLTLKSAGSWLFSKKLSNRLFSQYL